MDYKSVIKDRGLKIKWVAEQLGVGPELLSMKLSGKRNFVGNETKKLDVLLGLVNVEDREAAALDLFYNSIDHEVSAIAEAIGLPEDRVRKIINIDLKKRSK